MSTLRNLTHMQLTFLDYSGMYANIQCSFIGPCPIPCPKPLQSCVKKYIYIYLLQQYFHCNFFQILSKHVVKYFLSFTSNTIRQKHSTTGIFFSCRLKPYNLPSFSPLPILFHSIARRCAICIKCIKSERNAKHFNVIFNRALQ